MKFKGTQETIEEKIQSLGYQYEVKAAGSGIQFRTTDGAVLNWYPSTGTINFQGDASASAKLNEKLEPLLSGGGGSTQTASPVAVVAPAKVEAKGKVFVVHGHDQTSREQLELVLHKLVRIPANVITHFGGS
ncbi:hypothetical protein L0Z42_18455 [Burkholderia multivorans]|uniref:hypothetical protein n=1 Tax=Burkholderia multivorans TaxID=87883 RepID=UPI00201B79AB|nr:hypothetical protein [Burkholderia multivorans]MCO1372482.1 hypothetical protein [Burkholderia multivorans]MCO1465255.1 hypothetical protein [Burkholderia multivorans]UQO85617.1 hypothetical protein L0Y86_10585 [Burkholderia multivorans]